MEVKAAAGLVKPAHDAAVGGYNQELVTRVIAILSTAVDISKRIRLVTLQVAALLLRMLTVAVPAPGAGEDARPRCIMTEAHAAEVQTIKILSCRQLRDFYTAEATRSDTAKSRFLDVFEAEYRSYKSIRMNRVVNNASVPMLPGPNPPPSLSFEMRFPTHPQETVRRAAQIYCSIRKLSHAVQGTKEEAFPLRQPESPLALRDSISLANPRLVGCNVVSNVNGQRVEVRRFMLVDPWRLVLLEPDSLRLGRGIVRFLADIDTITVSQDPTYTRMLKVVVNDPARLPGQGSPFFEGQFVFDDHIRCMAARQVRPLEAPASKQPPCPCIPRAPNV